MSAAPRFEIRTPLGFIIGAVRGEGGMIRRIEDLRQRQRLAEKKGEQVLAEVYPFYSAAEDGPSVLVPLLGSTISRVARTP